MTTTVCRIVGNYEFNIKIIFVASTFLRFNPRAKSASKFWGPTAPKLSMKWRSPPQIHTQWATRRRVARINYPLAAGTNIPIQTMC